MHIQHIGMGKMNKWAIKKCDIRCHSCW